MGDTAIREELSAELCKAIRFREWDKVQPLLEAGADPDLPDRKGSKSGEKALHFAITYNESPCVQTLIRHGADVNGKSDAGRTPLHGAAVCGFSEQVQRLLRNGADCNVADNEQNTALHMAVKSCNNTVFSALLRAGASRDAKNADGLTADAMVFDDTSATYRHMMPVLVDLGNSINPAPLPDSIANKADHFIVGLEDAAQFAPENIGFWQQFGAFCDKLKEAGCPLSASDLRRDQTAHLLDYAAYFFRENDALAVLAEQGIGLTPQDMVDADGKARPYVLAMEEAGNLPKLFDDALWQGQPAAAKHACHRALSDALGVDRVRSQLPNYYQSMIKADLETRAETRGR